MHKVNYNDGRPSRNWDATLYSAVIEHGVVLIKEKGASISAGHASRTVFAAGLQAVTYEFLKKEEA